jgi:transcriptional regulator GlxA family with amidase domain
MLDSAGQLAASPASLQLADDIDRWIRMHIAEPITLDRLVAAAAVSPRTLQLACLARWGRSPMELLTHRRLELARSMLQSSQPGMLVTHAALRSGFSHLGRFAGQYKQFYGESPSETLERSVAGVRASRPAASADSTDPA